MADTRLLKSQVEDHVREELRREFDQRFTSQDLIVGSDSNGRPVTHEFDAVSADGTIIAGIKSSSGKTSSGRHPSGKVAAAYQELYFLSLAGAAKRRILVLTDPEFYAILKRHSDGRLGHGLELMLVRLSTDLDEKVRAVREKASREMSASAS